MSNVARFASAGLHGAAFGARDPKTGKFMVFGYVDGPIKVVVKNLTMISPGTMVRAWSTWHVPNMRRCRRL